MEGLKLNISCLFQSTFHFGQLVKNVNKNVFTNIVVVETQTGLV